MNILEKIDALPDDEQEHIMGLNIAELKELSDVFKALLRSARRVNGMMRGNPTYLNVAFTMRTAIQRGERLLEYSLPEEPDA